MPFGDILVHRRERGFLFGYGHIPFFSPSPAPAPGLHVAGLAGTPRRDQRHRDGPGPGRPGGPLPADVYLLHTLLLRRRPLPPPAVRVTLLSCWPRCCLAAAGAWAPGCLLVLTLAPLVTVVGYETVGHRHQRAMLAAWRSARGTDPVRAAPASRPGRRAGPGTRPLRGSRTTCGPAPASGRRGPPTGPPGPPRGCGGRGRATPGSRSARWWARAGRESWAWSYTVTGTPAATRWAMADGSTRSPPRPQSSQHRAPRAATPGSAPPPPPSRRAAARAAP